MITLNKLSKFFVIVSVVLYGRLCQAQIRYESGYFINNEGERTECLIKNVDWLNNPAEFDYKADENSESQKATIRDVKEFGILNEAKYQRFTVRIDRSGDQLNELTDNRLPEFTEETLFLKLLVEGKANLFSYVDGNLARYFYNVDNGPVEQLIYKSYRAQDNKIGYNNSYKQDLWNKLKCEKISRSDAERLNYQKIELVRYFVKYNACENSGITSFEAGNKRDLFNLVLRPGLNISTLSVYNTIVKNYKFNFDPQLNFRLGIEAEFVLPFNKNKWSIISEPTYQSYKAQNVQDGLTANVDYKSLELPFGIEHHFFLSPVSDVTISAVYIFDVAFQSGIDIDNNTHLKIKTRKNIAIEVGYDYKRKYMLGIRYGFNREILNNYAFWISDYDTLSFILGYRLF